MFLVADKCVAPKIALSFRAVFFTVVERDFLFATLLCTLHKSPNISYGAQILGVSSNKGVRGFYPQGTAKFHRY